MSTVTAPLAGLRSIRARRLSVPLAFALQVSMAVAFLAGSSAPTPLYRLYQAEWGFSPITVTVVFGVYAVAVLVALLTVGSLSDHIGRRPVLLVAVLVQAAVMIVFATAGGVPELVFARIVQGLSTGAALGALGAGLLDLDRAKGTVANAVAPLTGTALGALVSGILVQYVPAPEQAVYLVLLVVFLVQAVGVALMAESATPRPGALASLRPHLSLPATIRRPLLAAAPVLVAVWALGGFYASLGPSMVRLMAGSDSYVLGGLGLFVLAGSGAVTMFVLRSASAESSLLFGAAALLVGVGITVVAIATRSEAAFFGGTIVAGAGFGGGFQGALRTIVPLAAPHERAGVLSILFIVSYLALGLPAILGGVLVVYGDGVLPTAREYGAAVMVLAALALVALLVQRKGECVERPAAGLTPGPC